jgi:hypothetical protein
VGTEQATGGRPPLTLEQLVKRKTWRPDRHAHLLPGERPKFIDEVTWIRLLRRAGRRDEAREFRNAHVRHQIAERRAAQK